MTKNKVLIVCGSVNDADHVNAMGGVLRNRGIEYEWHAASAHKKHDRVKSLVKEYQRKKLPLVTIAGRGDALSGCASSMSDNPVIASRPDWEDINSLKLYFFSTVGAPSYVAPGTVLGPEQTAGYINKLLELKKFNPSSDNPIAFIGPESKKFVKALEGIGAGLKAKKLGYGEIGNAPVYVLFNYRDNETMIDDTLDKTNRPIIICPPDPNKEKIRKTTFKSFDRKYNPEVAMVLDPGNAALFAATIIGLYDDGVRKAVAMYKGNTR